MKRLLSLLFLTVSIFMYGQTNFPNSVTLKSSAAGPGATNQTTDTLIATLNTSTMKLGYKTKSQLLSTLSVVQNSLTPNSTTLAPSVTAVNNGLALKEDKIVSPTIYTIQAATTGNIRNDQPSFVTLDNGNILCAFNHFGASGSDIATAYIAGAVSTDGGKTWGPSFPLQTNISGALNTIVPSLYRRTDGKILMMYFVGIDPVPTPTSKIYKTVFNQDLTVFQAATDLGLTPGYTAPGSDRLYYDSANSTLLFPVSKLVSGDGTSYGSIYKCSILKSTDQGATWTDLNLNIGSTKLTLNFGGGIEPGIFYTSQGLVCYFRTLTGYTWGVKLDSSYAPTGSEYALYPSSNAQASIKYIPSKNIILATRTRLLDGNPIGDNSRKYLDLLSSEDGITFSPIDEIDFAPQTNNWLVNQPIIFDYNDEIIVGYNNSKTGALTASLLCKIYPKYFLNYKYNPYAYSGLLDDGRGKIYNGIQEINSTNNTKNTVSLKYPKGGTFYAASGTGAFKITMPNNKDANVTIKGRVVDENATNTFSFEITCNTSDMVNYNKVRVDYPELARALNVRFVNGTNPKIFIGDLASTWNNPSLIIDEVLASKTAYLTELSEGWKVELENSSYGTVAYTYNTADNSWLRSTTLKITNPPTGAAMTVDRGGGGFYVGVSSGVDGYLVYNLAGTTAFSRVFSNGNTIIGSSINTDPNIKLDVQGTFRASGEATVGVATANTSATQKLYVDAQNALKVTVNGDTKGASFSVGTKDGFDFSILRNNGIVATFGANGITLASSLYAIIGNLITSIDGGSNIRVGQISGANAETRISRTTTGADANAAMNVFYDNASATGDIVNFTSRFTTLSVKAGVRVDGRTYGTDASASNDHVTLSQLNSSIKLNNIQTKTANYTVTSTDYGTNGTAIFLVNATSGAVTITLDTPANMNNRIVMVKKIDASANSVTVKGNGSTNIDNANTLLLSTQNQNTTITSNTTQYYIF